VIGRESGSAQGSWDDACTASVPTLASLEPDFEIKVTDQRRSHNLKLNSEGAY